MRFILAPALIWPLQLQAGWFGYDNYEDCMLGKMKGQTQSMREIADKSCKKEFKVVFDIYISQNDWNFGPFGGDTENLAVWITKSPDEIEVISGDFSFAADCEGAKYGPPPIELTFSGNLARIPSYAKGKYARASNFKGRYKP